MRTFLRNPFIVGFAVLVLTAIAFRYMSGPPVCSDGWHSSSIGRSGACSHHGGVRHGWGGVVALMLALFSGFVRHVMNENSVNAARADAPPPRPPAVPIPQRSRPTPPREPTSESVEAMHEGEAKTRAYLQAYFKGRDAQRRRSRRR